MYHDNTKNLIVYPKSGSLNIRKQPVTTAAVLRVVAVNKSAGTTTGNYEKKADGYWFEVTGNGWVRQDVVKLKNTTTGQFVNINFNHTAANTNAKEESLSEAEAKKRMEAMFSNDRKTFALISKSNAYVGALKAKGVNTTNYETALIGVANSYTTRQHAINNNKNIKTERTGVLNKVAEGASWLWNKVNSLFHGTEEDELGFAFAALIPLIVPVVKWAAIAISSYFLYKAFKPSVDQSHVDLKKSEELEHALSTLNPEQRKKVETDIQGQIDNAYTDGKTNGSSSSSLLETVKTVGIIAACAFIGKKLFFDKKKVNEVTR